jgi:Protein of unknown function (DUF4238)
MSTPRNHHYVSQVHLNNFFNKPQNKIFVYDKVLDNFYWKETTKSLFSERDGSTRYVSNEKDFHSLENDLNIHFEKDFHRHLNTVKLFVQNFEMSENVNEALLHFAKYGVIGDMRTPRHKKLTDDAFSKAFGQLIPSCVPKLKKELEGLFAYQNEVKYSNVLEYSDIAPKILELMGGLIFKIIIPESKDDYFVVPDCTSLTMREKINTYFNPDIKEIAYIGLPITSKIYIHFLSEKLFKEGKMDSEIILGDPSGICKMNRVSLDISQSKIACENQDYLKRFINETKNIG